MQLLFLNLFKNEKLRMIQLTNQVLICLIIINVIIIIIHLCYPILQPVFKTCYEKFNKGYEKLGNLIHKKHESPLNKIFADPFINPADPTDPLDRLYNLDALTDTPEVHEILNETLDKKQKGKAKAKDNYRIANIYRHYVQNEEAAREHYAEALENMAQNPQDGDDYMLDQIEGFGMDIGDIRQLVAEDRIVRQTIALGARDVLEHREREQGAIQNPVFNINEVLADQPQAINANNILLIPVDKKKLKKLKGDDKKKYIKSLVKYTSDSQNVHDTRITDDISNYYEKIKNSPPTKKNIRDMIEHYKDRIGPTAYINALATFNNMQKNERFTKANAGERDILNAVWRRINAPVNKDRVEELNLSLVESMANCITVNGSVCISGRVANVIGSLGNIDDDVGILKTKEMVRNEVFAAAAHEMKRVLEAEKNTQGAKDFNAGVDSTESENMANLIQKSIETRLRNDFTGHVSDHELDLLIKESSAVF